MSQYGPIILVEDDEDDMQIFEQAVRELEVTNTIEWFTETKSALSYLLTTDEPVYIIFCDINLPGSNGLKFKKEIDDNAELRRKSIPFVFYSTVANQQTVNEAYSQMVIQGFFKKQSSYPQMKEMLRRIFDYWEICRHPNNTE